jgi:tetratricopeptide (TPR) repeat protein
VKALGFYNEALKIASEVGDSRGEANALFNMSLDLYAAGERSQATTCTEKALKIFEEIEDINAAKAREQLVKWRTSQPQ